MLHSISQSNYGMGNQEGDIVLFLHGIAVCYRVPTVFGITVMSYPLQISL